MDGEERTTVLPEQAVAFPAGTDVLSLARAWFPEAEILEAVPAARPTRLVGARFAGRQSPAMTAPGLLQVTSGTALRGPKSETAFSASLPNGLTDVYLLESTGPDPLVSSWLVAAARRGRGAVVSAGGGTLCPPADEVVDLTLYAAVAIDGEAALARARSVAPMTQLLGIPGLDSYRLALDTPYDGTVLLGLDRRTELPTVLTSLPADNHGPYAYALVWRAPSAAAESAASAVGKIARERVVPLVARLTLALAERAGGVVVDAGGFVVTAEDLQRRAAR